MATNVVELFPTTTPVYDITPSAITRDVIEWAIKYGIDIKDYDFKLKATTLVTLMQVIFNESRKV